jgi:hypothetical protein
MDHKEISWDHRHLYCNQEILTAVQEDAFEEITVDMQALEEVESFAVQAKNAKLQSKWIIWHLDFHLEENPLFIEDSAFFFSQGIAIGEFVEKLLRPFQEHTLGVSLFRGSADCSSYFIWTEQHEQYFAEKALEFGDIRQEEKKMLFSADVLSEYLQRLSSFLPDTVAVFCFFDASPIENPALEAYLFSKERFGHLLLALCSSALPLGHLLWTKKGVKLSQFPDAKVGFCLPCPEKISQEVLSLVEGVLQVLQKKNIPFRVIEESFLGESWDGIDDLIVSKEHLSVQGLRKIRGFLAAGGRVVSIGAAFGFEEEVGFESYFEIK